MEKFAFALIGAGIIYGMQRYLIRDILDYNRQDAQNHVIMGDAFPFADLLAELVDDDEDEYPPSARGDGFAVEESILAQANIDACRNRNNRKRRRSQRRRSRAPPASTDTLRRRAPRSRCRSESKLRTRSRSPLFQRLTPVPQRRAHLL